MGKHAKKTPFQKRKKEEKTKTKLKVFHKTILPKGKNITNTSFKVKKIVVRSQLKEHGEEVVSRNNLNVKELLSRLHHHNAPLRISALVALNEVVANHTDAVLSLNLPSLLHAASNLILDRELEVRNESIKLLSSVLSKATEIQLSPLFEIIIKYLACAMSHIDPNIRESSLTMLDVLISKNSKLTAKHCQPVILPAFLDLISSKNCDSERKLTLQYNNKMTTNIWRIKVLARLKSLLQAIVNIHRENRASIDKQEYVKKIKWTDSEPVYASLYHRPYDVNKNLDLSRVQFDQTRTQIDEVDEIKAYTEILLPLLLEIFIEVAPQKQKTSQTSQHLSNDAAVLFKFISDILLLLWQRFESSESSCYLKQWFSSTFAGSILEHLIRGRFPYYLSEHITDSFKNQKKNRLNIPGLPSDYSKFLNDKKCLELNISICHIYLLLYKFSEDSRELKTVINFITNLLKNCKQLDRGETVTNLLDCVDSIFSINLHLQKNKFDVVELIKIIKHLYDESVFKNDLHNTHIAKKTFSYLYKVALNQRNNNLTNEHEINQWLDGLPRLLTEKKVSFYTVKCISNLARCNMSAFVESLDGFIELILDHLPQLDIVSERKAERAEGKKLIINLLYYVKTWDSSFVKRLKKGIDSGYFSSFTNHVKDIMETRINSL